MRRCAQNVGEKSGVGWTSLTVLYVPAVPKFMSTGLREFALQFGLPKIIMTMTHRVNSVLIIHVRRISMRE